jgi:hypothetical protein
MSHHVSTGPIVLPCKYWAWCSQDHLRQWCQRICWGEDCSTLHSNEVESDSFEPSYVKLWISIRITKICGYCDKPFSITCITCHVVMQSVWRKMKALTCLARNAGGPSHFHSKVSWGWCLCGARNRHELVVMANVWFIDNWLNAFALMGSWNSS